MSFTLCELYLNKVVTKKRPREKSDKTRVAGVAAREKREATERAEAAMCKRDREKPQLGGLQGPCSQSSSPTPVPTNSLKAFNAIIITVVKNSHRRCRFSPWDGKISTGEGNGNLYPIF